MALKFWEVQNFDSRFHLYFSLIFIYLFCERISVQFFFFIKI